MDDKECSKIGGGFSDVDWGRTIERLPEMQDKYEHLSKKQSESVYQTFKECLGIGVVLDGVADLYDVIKKEHERREKEPTFYYHSDYLGSAAYLTNDVGQITQTLNYLPYGEDWVDRQEYHETRYPCLGIYTFNGKEKDYESGFHYYGARYYWSEVLTGWLSVDPMADKYPSISPYAYCAWNPVKLVDPDGNEALENDDWYKDKNGHIHWDASVHSQDDLKYGEEYLGKTVRMTAEGSDKVTYGDQYGHTHESVPLKEVSITATLTDFERTMSNPLVQSIHRSAAEFWGTALDIGIETGAQSFTYCGLGVQTIGFYCLAIPGGEAIGTELFAVGNALSSIGIGFDAINNIRKGDLTGLALDAVSIAAPRGISKQIDKGVSSGFLSATPKDINLINSYISTRTGYITETFNIGRKK